MIDLKPIWHSGQHWHYEFSQDTTGKRADLLTVGDREVIPERQ